MNTLTLIRGIPGSGKSTLAKQLVTANGSQVTEHFEADMYFMSASGIYNFDPSKLGFAHSWCMGITDDTLFYKKNVIVSNTFTTIKEMRPYVALAEKYNATLNIILCQSQFGSVHSVPESSMDAMRKRFAYDLSPLFLKPEPVKTEDWIEP
jgi:predicted kinase